MGRARSGSSRSPRLRRLQPPALLLLPALLLACRSEPARDPERTIPSSLLVRQAAASAGPRGPLDPADLVRQVAGALERAEVFSRVSAEGEGGAGGPVLRSDYVCEIGMAGRGFAVERSEANAKAILSTVVWFLSVFPAWWIDDRSYPDSDLEVRARFYSAGAAPGARPILSEVISTKELDLDLWSRGAVWQLFLSLLLPPFWMEDAGKAEKALARDTVRKARTEIAESVRADWPAALLQGEPGAFLILDPPAAVLEPARGKVDLAGWLASRSALVEARLFDERGRVLARLDQKALAARAVAPPRNGREPEEPGWRLAAWRLGPNRARPRLLYRLEFRGIEPEGLLDLHLETFSAPGTTPARFTVRVGERR